MTQAAAFENFLAQLMEGIQNSHRKIVHLHSGSGSRIRGASGVLHQVDVQFVDHDFQRPTLVLVECKRLGKEPVGLTAIKILKAVRDDCVASQEAPGMGLGILVTTTRLTNPARKFADYYGIRYQSVSHGGGYGYWYERIFSIGLELQAAPASTEISGEVFRTT